MVVNGTGDIGSIAGVPIDPDHAYRVRHADGKESSYLRRELSVLNDFQTNEWRTRDPLDEHALGQCVVYRCVIGSRAYGLDHEGSDTDRRGVYVPPARMHWSVFGVPEQLENEQTQECYWEIEKCVRLALKANPNVLEVLHSPIVEHIDPTGQMLLDIRDCFVSKLIYQTFNGYAIAQFRKIEQDLRTGGRVKWKHAMHLIRLLHSGTIALKTGRLPVRVEDPSVRVQLISIRNGEMAWDHVDALRLQLHRAFEAAFADSTLPDRPDHTLANRTLVAIRATMAQREHLDQLTRLHS